MIVAIDFDETFTADQEAFLKIIAVLRSHGHTCIMVTQRMDGVWTDGRRYCDEVRATVGDLLPIVCAGRKNKRAAARNAGYEVDVWIDDSPHLISSP